MALLLSISDWWITMSDPGGLLLVVPHVCTVPLSVLLVGTGVAEKKKPNLDV